MKKVLLASTALMLSAGVASAELALTGSANMGVKYMENAADELIIHWEVDTAVVGSGETDGGMSFGAEVQLDSGPGPASAGGGKVFVSGGFGTLTVGGIDPATDGFGIADVGFDGIGVDDDAESLKNAASDGQDVHYAYSFGDFGVSASVDSLDSDDAAVAATYDAGMFNVGLGYAQFAGESSVTIAGGASFGEVSVNVIATDWSGGATAYGGDVSFGLGDITVTAVVGATDVAGDDEDYGIGASYSLGGGATLAGGVGSVDGTMVADFGINLSF